MFRQLIVSLVQLYTRKQKKLRVKKFHSLWCVLYTEDEIVLHKRLNGQSWH